MTLKTTSPWWANADVTGETENWTIDVESASRRMGCSSTAPAIVANTLNHLLGRTAQIAFAMSTPNVAGEYRYPDNTNSVLPLYEFMTPDLHKEATEYIAHITHMPPDPDLNWATWTNTYITTNVFGGGETVNALHEINTSESNHYVELLTDALSLNRGNVTNTNVFAQFNAYGGFRPVDIVVYAVPARTLDSDLNHGSVEPAKAKPSIPVLNDIAEDCRARFAELRTQVIPLASTWAAQGTATGFSQAGSSPGDQLGMVVESSADGPNTRVNLLDHDVTSRNSDTPGIYVHGYRQGIGPEDTAGGTTVYYELHALASATNSEVNGRIYAETAWSNTSVTVARPDPTWVAVTDIVINSAQDESGATEKAARTNKIDIYGSCNSGGLYVHGFTVKAKVPQTAV
jgi:hypothetical protein